MIQTTYNIGDQLFYYSKDGVIHPATVKGAVVNPSENTENYFVSLGENTQTHTVSVVELFASLDKLEDTLVEAEQAKFETGLTHIKASVVKALQAYDDNKKAAEAAKAAMDAGLELAVQEAAAREAASEQP